MSELGRAATVAPIEDATRLDGPNLEPVAEQAPQPVVVAPLNKKTNLKQRLFELIRFGLVGGVAFVIHNLVFILVNGPIGWGPTIAKTLAVVVATAFAYVGSRFFTFAARKTANVRHETISFFVVNAVGLVIELIPLWISHYLLGFQTAWADWFSGVIIGSVFGTLFRYFAYRYWVFTGDGGAEIAGGAAGSGAGAQE